MCAWMYVLVPHTIQRANVGICLQDCEHAFKCTHSGEKVRLNKWEIFTHVWAKVHTHSTSHSCDTLHTVSEVRRLKIVRGILPEFFRPHRGSPLSYSHLIIVTRQGCSGTSELSYLPTSSWWLGGGKTGNSVCLGMCGEGVKLVPVLGSAGNTVYCSCCQKKAL